jgi:hypothetical protein
MNLSLYKHWGRAAKVNDGIRNLSLRNYLVDQYKERYKRINYRQLLSRVKIGDRRVLH